MSKTTDQRGTRTVHSLRLQFSTPSSFPTYHIVRLIFPPLTRAVKLEKFPAAASLPESIPLSSDPFFPVSHPFTYLRSNAPQPHTRRQLQLLIFFSPPPGTLTIEYRFLHHLHFSSSNFFPMASTLLDYCISHDSRIWI